VAAIFADRLLRGEPVTIFGDGEQTRDSCSSRLVDAFVRAATRGGGLVLNVGTGRELSINELARVMAEVAGNPTAPIYAPARPGELQRSALDPERRGSIWGGRHGPSFPTGCGPSSITSAAGWRIDAQALCALTRAPCDQNGGPGPVSAVGGLQTSTDAGSAACGDRSRSEVPPPHAVA